jgi:hypothetical protein
MGGISNIARCKMYRTRAAIFVGIVKQSGKGTDSRLSNYVLLSLAGNLPKFEIFRLIEGNTIHNQ